MSESTKRLAFESWYRRYNPDLEMTSDTAVDELKDCFYTAWDQSLRVEHQLNHLEKLGQEFDND